MDIQNICITDQTDRSYQKVPFMKYSAKSQFSVHNAYKTYLIFVPFGVVAELMISMIRKSEIGRKNIGYGTFLLSGAQSSGI